MYITFHTNHEEARTILSYIYDILNKDVENNCECIDIEKDTYRDYKNGNMNYIFYHKHIPENGKYNIDDISINLEDLVLNNEIAKINFETHFFIIKKLTLSSEKRENIINFVEKAINFKSKEQTCKFINNFGDKIEKKKLFFGNWIFDAAIPKRNIDTLFLKEGQLDKIKNPILSFIQKETYKDYNKHGIPYKMNILLHGSPGVGKTSLIHTIASVCDACICNLNINIDLSEDDMIKALSNVSNYHKNSIVVIEDIDCIFTDRKEGDTHKNRLTMSGLLNCLDGFNNPEGLIVIITTNFPDKLDDALVRSGRIDLNIELTHLDKYQASNMFKSFFNNKDDIFEVIWNNIKKYKVEPATLIQFLFNNRNCINIADKFQELYNYLEKKLLKNPKNDDLYI
jgi:adenylate kinase family enzyme